MAIPQNAQWQKHPWLWKVFLGITLAEIVGLPFIAVDPESTATQLFLAVALIVSFAYLALSAYPGNTPETPRHGLPRGRRA